MVKSSIKGMCFVLIFLFVICCACSTRTESTKQDIKAGDVSLEELDSIIEEKIKTSPILAIKIEKYATDTLRKEIEKLRKEKEILDREVERQIKEKEVFRAGTEVLREDKKQLSEQVLQLSQERDQSKELNAVIPGYQQKIFELEARVSTLMNEQKDVQIGKEKAQKPSSIISIESENNRVVPVLLSASADGVSPHNIISAYFKITSKKTQKFFVYEVRGYFSSGDLPMIYKTINLDPGEYTVQVSKPYTKNYLPSPPQTFTVSEEPIAEVKGEKIHALVDY